MHPMVKEYRESIMAQHTIYEIRFIKVTYPSNDTTYHTQHIVASNMDDARNKAFKLLGLTHVSQLKSITQLCVAIEFNEDIEDVLVHMKKDT